MFLEWLPVAQAFKALKMTRPEVVALWGRTVCVHGILAGEQKHRMRLARSILRPYGIRIHQFYYQIALLWIVHRYARSLDFNHLDNVTMLDRSEHLDVLGHFKRGSLE